MSWQGGQSSLTITRTSGTCGWQASADVNWISLANPSGNGSGTLAFTVGGNGFNSRTGVITVEWTGGRAQMTVFQGTPPDTCVLTLTVGGQSTIAVPQAGGQFTAYLLPAPGVPPMACDGVWNASASSSAIAFIGSTTGINGNGTVTFTVAPNGTSAARTLFVSVSGSGSATLRLNQSP